MIDPTTCAALQRAATNRPRHVVRQQRDRGTQLLKVVVLAEEPCS